MSTTRRTFLGQGLGAATLMASGATLPGFLSRTALATLPSNDETILVVIQLTGGNDGINTVIPYADDLYHKARPTLGIAPNRVLKLNDQLGLHPDMEGFQSLHDQGMLSVVMNVGYPNPDRSHFKSMDIWHSATLDKNARATGWLGRLADEQSRAGAPPFAMQLDDQTFPLALRSDHAAVPSVRDVRSFHLNGKADQIRKVIQDKRQNATQDLLFVQRAAVESCNNAKRIESAQASQRVVRGKYPAFGLANKLSQISDLIAAGFGTRVYYTSLGGFDTHARQVLRHGSLLRELSESVNAFYADLAQQGLAKRVLVLTFSEFGRRVKENGSRGTDHGAAAPMFVIGPASQAGIIGKSPDLGNLVEGDVPFQTDFRGVYSDVLQNWLKTDPEKVLGRSFKTTRVVGKT